MKKKGIVITIIVILIILAIAGGVFAYVYFATDLLLSEKQGFGKYTAQIVAKEEGFFSSSIEEYFSKKETTPYTISGSINANTNILADTTNYSSLQELQNIINYGNNTSINFTGKVDSVNKKLEQDITVNYSDTVNLPFRYKVDGDIYGIQADSIAENYIAIKNENLPELFQKLGVSDVSNIPNKIEFKELQSLKFTEEEKTHILNQYILSIYNNLPEEKFSKLENADASTTYTLTLTTEEAKSIYLQTLETLKNDKVMIDKINSIVKEIYEDNYDSTEMELTPEIIQEEIDKINQESVEPGNIQIAVTQKDRLTSEFSITSNTAKISLSKQETEANISYTLSYILLEEGIESATVTLNTNFSGINTNNITESYDININNPEYFDTQYSYSNTVAFDNNINIEPLSTSNAAILNNYSAEQLQPFLLQLGIKIVQINTEQMTQIGYPIEYINPLVMWGVSPVLINSTMDIAGEIDVNQGIDNATSITTDDAINEINQNSINSDMLNATTYYNYNNETMAVTENFMN